MMPRVTQHEKIVRRLMSGASDRSFRFDDLCLVLRRAGFVERHHRGSHRIFSHPRYPEILNIQPGRGWLAKPYQVRQVRRVLLRYGLANASPEMRDEQGE
jgi:hypothetical protein